MIDGNSGVIHSKMILTDRYNIQELILPYFIFLRLLIFAVKLKCLLQMEKINC